MGVSIATTRVACNTSTGTQDITIPGFGTAKAVRFKCSVATVDGTAASHLNMSYGAATGASNEWCLSLNSEDGQGTSDTQATTDSDRVVRINTAGGPAIDGDAEFTAFVTDGVRINWLTAPSAAWLLEVTLYGGTDLSVHASNVTLGDSVDNVVDVTAPGFEPDIVYAVCQGSLGIDDNATHLQPSFGLVHNGVGITQSSVAYRYTNGASTMHVDGRMTETYGIMQVNSTAALVWGGEFGAFDANGFSVTTRIAGAGNTVLMYLAMSFGGAVNSWVGTIDTPTSTGNAAVTASGFTPQFVDQIGTHMEAIDTAYNDSALAGTFGFSSFDASREYMTSVQVEENVGTSNTQSLSDNTAIELPDDDGAVGLTASFVSMDANGWTLNYTAVETNAKKFLTLAIEQEAIGGHAGPLVNARRLRSKVGGGLV